MDFNYSRPATGKNFIGRRQELSALGNLLTQGENIILYAPPKTGKTSLVEQALFNLRTLSRKTVTVRCSLLDVRSASDFALRLGSAILAATGSTPVEYADLAERHLDRSHLIFDPERYGGGSDILSLSWDADERDVRAVVELPYALARERGIQFIIVLDEFQNVLLTGSSDMICSRLEAAFEAKDADAPVSFILCGSAVNAMKYLTGKRHFFHKSAVVLPLPAVDEKEIADYMNRIFLTGGKVPDRNLLLAVCRLLRCHLGYLNQYCAICDSATRGYLMAPAMNAALDALVSLHEPHFRARMADLTGFQVSLLRALLEGHDQFSSASVIRRYALHSSANVCRVKDALCKKEILSFDENDKAEILDPLFEFWARRDYFKIDNKEL